MVDSISKEITEQNKQRLVRYLIERTRTGISGRDGQDLEDVVPSRAIFAGVLYPPYPGEAATRAEDSRRGTALGLDFRVIPAVADKPVSIRIHPRWSHYFAVFPTWEQTTRSNSPNRELSPEDPGGAASEVDDEEPADQKAVGSAAPKPKGALDSTASRRNALVLPRVFRRIDVAPGGFVADLPSSQSERRSIAADELAGAIRQAKEKIALDPDQWRHLADLTRHQRELNPEKMVTTAADYREALAAITGEPVTLPPWSVQLLVESRSDTTILGALRIRVLLANTTPAWEDGPNDPGLEAREMFDAGLVIEVDGGEVLPFDFLLAPKDYRSQATMPAKGIACTARWDAAQPCRLETDTLPIFEQPLYRTRSDLEVTFQALDSAAAISELERIGDEMRAYLAVWDQFLSEQAPLQFSTEELEACRRDRNAFQVETERYELGIEALRRDPRLGMAFRYMNAVFARLSESSGGRIRAWRLFQIGFIVSQLPALAVRELPDGDSDSYANALRQAFEEVGVLWFPTGGGKTEAYLGLIATALIYDRLRGKTRGVCAWMRFPLRMLSLQQLERLARVIAKLNELRAEVSALRVGDPFAIGYFVGQGVTPNNLSAEDMTRYKRNEAMRDEALLLRKCPFCGSAVNIEAIEASWRLAHVCTNSACFSNTSDSLGSYKGSLPVCIVDTEIYRYLPSVLVGTVDKLAIIGREQRFVHLVRGVSQQCPTHGYTSYDECIERWSTGANCKVAKGRLVRLAPVKDPGPSLLIQDELHLLRAELGVFSGHYEGLLRYLGERASMPPKVLAATATIEAYDTHAFHLYLSRSRRYPQPSWRQGESFYATSTPAVYRRFYVGVLGHTRGIEEVALRLIGLYWREIRTLLVSPRLAADIMGCPAASDNEVLDTLRLYDLSLAYVNRKATGGSLIDKVGLAEQLLTPGNLGKLGCAFLTGDQTIKDVGATIDRIERERQATEESRLDLIAATNLISHGVDLERINMMAICGMPSHFAEYVQASSRAARSHPGLIWLCHKASDPRELSQYEFFPAIHENLDRLIEPVAVNRFASFAPQKTLPGLVSALLLCDLTPSLYGSKISRPLDHVPTLRKALGIDATGTGKAEFGCIDQVELLAALERIIGVDRVRFPASESQVEVAKRQVEETFGDIMGAIGRTMESRLKDVVNPITSFRDVDEGIDFGSFDSSDLAPRLRSR